MILREMVERFERRAPICTMIRAAMENVLAAERLDALFEATVERQENKALLFSTVADLMGLVACKIHPTVPAAYQAKQEQVGVTAKAVYDKLPRMETSVSRAVVRETASRMGAIIGKMPNGASPLVRSYHVKILDGNHWRRTERRIGELRELNVAPLPGHAIVVLDPQRKLAMDVFPCEDAHAQERTLLPSVLETVAPQDLWIGDRNFCTTNVLVGIERRLASFVIRQNAGMGYPKAALFACCMALVAYNVLSVVQAALRAAHGEEVSEQVSFYYLCDEVAGTYRGLLIAVPESYWERTDAGLTPTQMARRLVSLAQGINLSRYRKHRRGPKKPPKKFNKHHRGHASTARILAQAT